MKARRFLGDLSLALRRVANEYKDAEHWRGDQEFEVTVTLVPLEREQSHRLYERIAVQERVSQHDRTRGDDDALAAIKAAKLGMTVQNFSNASAALSGALDILRQALHEEGLADIVDSIDARVVPSDVSS